MIVGPGRQGWTRHLRWLRPVGFVVVVLAIAARSGWDGLLALEWVGIAGLAGVLAGGVTALLQTRWNTLTFLSLLVLVAGTAALVSIDPDGPAFLGGFVAAWVAAAQAPPREAARLTAGTLAVLAIACVVGVDRPLMSAALGLLGDPFEVVQGGAPELVQFTAKGGQAIAIDFVNSPRADRPVGDEARPLQYAQVLRDRRPADR